MNIALFDSWNGKFSTPIKTHWESLGHKVRFNPSFEQAIGADLNFFYQADNVFVTATKTKELTGKTFAQCIDIEVWSNQPQTADWTKANGCIFMAKHIQDKVQRETKIACPVKLIKPGIDLTKWTFREKKLEDVRRIAYVVGDRRIWDVKRLDIAFQLLRDLLDSGGLYQLHIRGTYSSHEQYNAYCKYLEKDLDLGGFVVWYPEKIEDLNAWLGVMDYYLNPSTKEAFSYATAEAMAKGIKPIINNWESSKENWAPFVCETYGQMLGRILKDNYEPQVYRNFIEENYDQNRYFKELDEFVLGGDLHV
jgi:glycosyltransferase involved in cell wall biosynthesis